MTDLQDTPDPRTGTHRAAPAVTGLAILPFRPRSTRSGLGPRARELARELCYALSGTPGLRLASPHATERFASSTASAIELGIQLNVDAVVTGELDGTDSDLVLDWQLRGVPSGEVVVEASVRAGPEHLLTEFAALIRRIGSALGIPVDADALDQSAGTRNGAAFLACLSGRGDLVRETEAALERAETAFREAVRQDPDYLAARVGLLDTWRTQLRFWRRDDPGLIARIDDGLERIRKLDPGGMRLNWDSLLPAEEDPDFWDMASREARCREAVLHNRTDPVSGHSARHLYGDLLSESGLFHGALDYFLLCEKEEPPDAHLCALIGHTLAILDDPQAALERMTRALEIDPHFVLGATYLIAMLDRTGAHAEAGRELERISDDLGETLTRAARMTGLHWRGETEALKDLVTELESDPGVSPFFKGIGRVMLEDDGAAIAWFEQGYRGRDMFVRQLREKIPFYLGPGPWERLMGRQRFRILLRTLNLDDAWRDLHRHRANLLTPVTGIHVSD